MNQTALYIAAGLAALFLLTRPKAASTWTSIPASNGQNPNDKDYNPGSSGKGGKDYTETLISLYHSVIGDNGNGGNGKVGCGPKPKVPVNYLSLPTDHPVRVARQKWEACKGHKYDKHGKKIS